MAETLNTPVLLKTPIADKATSDNIMDLPLEYNEETDYGIGGQDIGFPTECRLPIRYSDGTPGKGRPPKMQIMNMMMKTVSSHNFYAQNGGTYTFSQQVSDAIGGYPKGSVLWYAPTNGVPYQVESLLENNTNNFVLNPALIDGVHWKKINATSEELDNYVKLTGNQSIGGVKTFTSPIRTETNSSRDLRKRDYFNQYTKGVNPSQDLFGNHIHDNTGEELAQNLASVTTDGRFIAGQWVKSAVAGQTNSAWGCRTQASPDGTFHTYAITPSSDSNDASIATTSWVRANVGGGIPVGTILPYGGTTAPTGFLLCNGGAISRTTYANLFSVIGTTYGAGNGSTTFNLPNQTGENFAGIPTYNNGIDIHTYRSSSNQFTAPENGLLLIFGRGNSGLAGYINNIQIQLGGTLNVNYQVGTVTPICIKKGDTFYTLGNDVDNRSKFYPFVGDVFKNKFIIKY